MKKLIIAILLAFFVVACGTAQHVKIQVAVLLNVKHHQKDLLSA